VDAARTAGTAEGHVGDDGLEPESAILCAHVSRPSRAREGTTGVGSDGRDYGHPAARRRVKEGTIMREIREWIRRLLGSCGRHRHDRELQQELQLHLELAAEDARRRGESAEEARRSARLQAGSVSQAMGGVRDQRSVPWLNALFSDVRFGWRQVKKHRTSRAAAILSLGLAIGATTAAFQLVDAVLLRTLPVSDPASLFYVAFNHTDSQGRTDDRDDFDYPTYRQYAPAIGNRAELMVVGMSAPLEVIVNGGDEPERIFR